jgi:hypothetical protein
MGVLRIVVFLPSDFAALPEKSRTFVGNKKSMDKIYRLRPAQDTTLDELKSGYLWFSRPTGFNDVEDANIIAFTDKNENIKDAFDRVFSNHSFLAEELSYIGICCFTDILPKQEKWKRFPKGNKGIFIEYDKTKVEQYFLDKHYLGDCFREVEYLDKQLLIESSTNDGYDVLWEVYEDGCLYLSIRGDIERDIKKMDQFILKLLTRINSRFKEQKELRIILSGTRIPTKDPHIKGYKIPLPSDFITRIYIQDTTPDTFVSELKKNIDGDKIQLIKD